jgi:hypothetical protein
MCPETQIRHEKITGNNSPESSIAGATCVNNNSISGLKKKPNPPA